MTTSNVEALIEAGIPGSKALVRDRRGTGSHFEAVVIAPPFTGRSLVEQHRLVYQACGSRLKKDIHALQLQTFNPTQWESAEKEGTRPWIWQPESSTT